MKIGLIFLSIFNLLALSYLLSPLPYPPDLSQSIKSTLPGDTVQITNVAGYFTNLDRQQVFDYYQNNYHPPFSYWLNHPPEKSKQIFQDTIQSYYLQELVIPFKGSLFVNGFEWEKDVFTKPEKRIANKILVGDQEFKAKITTRYFYASLPTTLFSFYITQSSLIIALIIAKKVFFPSTKNQK